MKHIILISLFVCSLLSNELLIKSDSQREDNLNVLFSVGSFQIEESQQKKIDEYVDFLFTNYYLSVNLFGHTDSMGTKQQNIKLAIKRVETVKEYLISEGILESRISTISCGESKPKVSNQKEKDRQINRRVESTTFVTFE